MITSLILQQRQLIVQREVMSLCSSQIHQRVSLSHFESSERMREELDREDSPVVLPRRSLVAPTPIIAPVAIVPKKEPEPEEEPLKVVEPVEEIVKETEVDPNEPLYCVCKQVSFGEMIAVCLTPLIEV
jgi:hypothetical protein